MTAEIGLLNKSAVVIAADSAVTIGQGVRVYNNANKIFEFKSCRHIGIMVYNQASLEQIPIETIIKLYTNSLNRTYRNLKDYAVDFNKFLTDFLRKHITQIQYDDNIEALTYLTLDALHDSVTESINERISESKTKTIKNIDKTTVKLYKDYTDFILDDLKKKDIQKEFEDFSFEEFKDKYSHIINKIVDLHKHHYSLSLDDKILGNIIEILYLDCISIISTESDFTGIIIAGFGEDEIYPGYVELLISGFFENRLRWTLKLHSNIDNDKTVIVRPFAQRDMSDVFFQGIDQDLKFKIIDLLNEEYHSIFENINKRFRLSKKEKEEIEKELANSFSQLLDKLENYQHSEYINPTVDTIELLRKEDLIEIAESLISITSLKRKTAGTIQSVGGPIDIAVITKGDGFKWVKSKHFEK